MSDQAPYAGDAPRLPAGYERTRLAAFFFALLPGGMIAYFAVTAGGYFAGSTALAAAFLAVMLGLRLLLLPVSITTFSRLLVVALVALGGLVVWTYVSGSWSGSEVRATLAADKTLVYFLALLLFGSFPTEVRRLQLMLRGVTVAIVGICALAVGSRLFPDVIGHPGLLEYGRLNFPLSYWNALGIFAGTGLVFSVHFAKTVTGSRFAKALAAAAVPLLVTTLYLTLSRGGIVATAAALVIYLVLARPAGTLGMLVAVVPASAVALSATIAAPELVTTAFAQGSAPGPGHGVGLVIGACMAAAGLARFLLTYVEAAVDFRSPLATAGRNVKIAVGVTAAIVVIGVVGAVAGDRIAGAWNTFFYGTSTPTASLATGADRLDYATNEGRIKVWDAAIEQWSENPLIGEGAGTFALASLRSGLPGYQINAHSVFLETLGELGIVGGVLLAAALLSILVGFAWGIRGDGRSLHVALFAAMVAWLLHSAIDWDWQMPATTFWVFALGGAALATSTARGQRSSTFVRTYRGGLAFDRSGMVRIIAAASCFALAIVPARIAIAQAKIDQALLGLKSGDCNSARSAAAEAAEITPWRVEPHVILGQCLGERGDTDAAIAHLRQAIDADPGNPFQQYRLAQLLAGDGRDPRRPMARAAALSPTYFIFGFAKKTFDEADSPAEFKRAAKDFPPLGVTVDPSAYPELPSATAPAAPAAPAATP